VFISYLGRKLDDPTVKWPVEAYNEAVVIYMRRNEWTPALLAARKASQIFPTFPRDGILLALKGMHGSAPTEVSEKAFREVVQEAAKAGQSSYTARYVRHLVGSWKGFTVAGETFLGRYVRNEASEERHRAWGQELLAQGWDSLAAVEFERAVILGDTSEELYLALLRCYRGAGDVDRFQSTLRVAASLHPNSDELKAAAQSRPGPVARTPKAAVAYPEWVVWTHLLRTRGGIGGHILWKGGRIIYPLEDGNQRSRIRGYDPVVGRMDWEVNPNYDLPPYYTPPGGKGNYRSRTIVNVKDAHDSFVVDYNEWGWEEYPGGSHGVGDAAAGSIGIDPATGRILWRRSISGHWNREKTWAVDAKYAEKVRKAVRWESRLDFAFMHDRTLITLKNNQLTAKDEETGKVLWRYPIESDRMVDISSSEFAAMNPVEGSIVGLRVPDRLADRRAVVVRCAERQKDSALAEEILLTALDADPGHEEAHAALARLVKKRRISDEAKSRLGEFALRYGAESPASKSAAGALKQATPVRWTAKLAKVEGAAFDPERVYILTKTALVAVRRDDGKPIWNLKLDTPTTPGYIGRRLTLDQGVLYFTAGGDYLRAVEAGTGKALWTYQVSPGPGGCCSELRSPVVQDGSVFVHHTWERDWNSDGKAEFEFIKVAAGSGRLEWKVPITPGLSRYNYVRSQSARPAFSKGKVYFPAETGALYAFDIKFGKPSWSFQLESSTSVAMAMGDPIVGGDIVYSPAADGAVYALDSDTGKLRWKIQAGGPRWEGPKLDTTVLVGDKLCFNHCDNKLWCLDAATGQTAWRQGAFFFNLPPAYLKGSLWGSSHISITAVNPTSGQVRSQQSFPWMGNIESLATDGSWLYVIHANGVTQLDPSVAME